MDKIEKIDPESIEVKLEDFFTKVLAVIGRTTDLQLSSLLKENKQTIAVAESITAGMISTRLTNIPGSSEYFIGGIVCYHNRAKVMELGISPSIIAKYGPVSKEVAVAMAEGVKNRLKTDIGLAITGVAGPKPEANSPVGTVFISLSSESGTQWKQIHLQGTRSEIREKAAQAALGLLWLNLGGEEVIEGLGEK